ncbi:MAG: hypothetical protein ACIAQF_02865 [Phycisphaerales bacterium JB065]
MEQDIVNSSERLGCRDHLSIWFFEFAVACCFITPLVYARFSSSTGYTYTFVVGRHEWSHGTVAAVFSPIGLLVMFVSWSLNRLRKRREFTICAGVLVGHCGLVYGLPLLPEGVSELPDLFYIVLAGVLCISLILTAYVDQRKRGSGLGFVLGLFFSPASMIAIGITVYFAMAS